MADERDREYTHHEVVDEMKNQIVETSAATSIGLFAVAYAIIYAADRLTKKDRTRA